MTHPTVARIYRSPSVTVDASVSLDEFDDADIREYLRHKGYNALAPGDVSTGSTGGDDCLLIDSEDLAKISTLHLCGQIEPARRLALDIIGSAIGRTL